MAKGYWIARVDVHTPERYGEYIAAAKPAFERYEANFIARGGKFVELEDGTRSQRGHRISIAAARGRLLQLTGVSGRSQDPPGNCHRRDGRGRRRLASQGLGEKACPRNLTN